MQYYHPEPTPQDTYYLAILIPQSAFKQTELDKHYIQPLLNQGFNKQDIVVFPLLQGDKGKTSAALMKEYLVELLTWLKAFDIKLLYVADAGYFKHLTKISKVVQQTGYVLPCKAKDYGPYSAIYGVNYRRLFTEPKLTDVLTRSLTAVSNWKSGNYNKPGDQIIKAAYYPTSMEDIRASIQSLLSYTQLVIDIETTSLKFYEAELASIAFCYADGCGLAFTIGRDHTKEEQYQIQSWLKDFFTLYEGNSIYHNCNYDVKILVYRLFMQSEQDQKGLLCGLDWLTRRWEDTKIISYLATNTTTGNSLSLKDLAQSYAGDYGALEDGSIANLSTSDLLEYNLKDTLATWWVYHTYYPLMQQDKQEELYKTLLLPTAKVIVQMELTGMPINPVTVESTCAALLTKEANLAAVIAQHPLIQSFTLVLRQQTSAKQHMKWKVKQEPLSYFDYVVFNPNSDDQVRELLYPYLGLPVIDTTDSGLPSTAGDTLKKLRNHTSDPQVKDLLQAFIDYLAVNKINSTFVPILQNAPLKADGRQYIHGSFNICGTKSGRMASSQPNMTNLPSGKTYGKAIKENFEAPKGKLMIGADFAGLEDMISALLTKDPNKLKVFLDGYCGHCLRSFSYYRDQMPDIVETVDSINSIAKQYPLLRQASKAVSFSCQYFGTYRTLMANLGLPEEQARAIEANYHRLYQVSDQWSQDRFAEASRQGYVELAFGLRLRTPLMAQTLLGKRSTPFQAAAESRTVGNAIGGQSYCQLTNRALVEFMQRVWISPYRYRIQPICMIHDAIYLLIEDSMECVLWTNHHLIDCMQWQELPEIQHPTVKLGAKLELYPTWAKPIQIPNHATAQQVTDLIYQYKHPKPKS